MDLFLSSLASPRYLIMHAKPCYLTLHIFPTFFESLKASPKKRFFPEVPKRLLLLSTIIRLEKGEWTKRDWLM
jgi:hypothetical protein